MTWNFFGPFMSAPEPERVQLGNWLLSQLEPGAELNRTCEFDLWRRIPHPDNLVPGGPEIDFLVVGDRTVIFGEAKRRSSEGKSQGLDGNKTQVQLRSELLSTYGRRVYGDRRFYVLLLTLDQAEAPAASNPSVTIARLTWNDLCAYPHHPTYTEVSQYYKWKRNHTR